jgi:hypothetical protein
MKVKIELMETSQGIELEEVTNTYTKGPFFCIYKDGIVSKVPVDHIFRVTETYGHE